MTPEEKETLARVLMSVWQIIRTATDTAFTVDDGRKLCIRIVEEISQLKEQSEK